MGVLSNIVVNGEVIKFNYTLPGTGFFPGGIDVFRYLLEPGGAHSDTFRFCTEVACGAPTDGGSTAFITFASDTAIDLTGSTHLVDLFSGFPDLTEDGSFQNLVSVCPQAGCGTSNPGDDISTFFQARSPLPGGDSTLPEPSSIAFGSMALFCVVLAKRRRTKSLGI